MCLMLMHIKNKQKARNDMSKYIKETVVKDYVWVLLNSCGHGGLIPQDINEQVTRCVEYMLSERDCVEIVRCKDCMLNTINTDGATEHWCYKFGYAVEDTDFCSYGERKDNE